jgi:hypothetical protein
MYCPNCGTQNADSAVVCVSCGQTLPTLAPAAAPGAAPVEVKVSGWAIAAFVLGILSIFTCGLTVIPAIIVGIIALVKISNSGGRRTGLAFAVIGLVLPIVLIPLLMGILMPALARTRQLAFRMTCGTNLAGIGKAMLVYANDYQDKLPRAGGPGTAWSGRTPDWRADSRAGAFGLAADGSGGRASVGSSLYLLVKYAEVTPKSFICKGDAGVTEFVAANYGVGGRQLIDLWDFGPNPAKHCSYAYHLPYGTYAVTTSNHPGFAVAADRNPWIDSPSQRAQNFLAFKPDLPPHNGTVEQARRGNAISHQQDGQNVLFLDSHVEFAKRAYCGLQNDNIYTVSGNAMGADPLGTPPAFGSEPSNKIDSVLVNDWPTPDR